LKQVHQMRAFIIDVEVDPEGLAAAAEVLGEVIGT
jgi:hypothetical protein